MATQNRRSLFYRKTKTLKAIMSVLQSARCLFVSNKLTPYRCLQHLSYTLATDYLFDVSKEFMLA